MIQQSEYNAQDILDQDQQQQQQHQQQSMGQVIPIKRSTLTILPTIKPEPDALSPSCVSTLVEPTTPPSKSSLDVCSNISNCSSSITPPTSASVMIPK